MQTDDVRAFKNELRNYNYYLSRIVTLANSIEFVFERLGGVRGIDPSKEPIHAMPDPDLEWKLRDQIEIYEAEKRRYEAKAGEIDQILGKMETSLREAVIEVYANGKTVMKVADRMYLSPSGLKRRIDKAIKKALG